MVMWWRWWLKEGRWQLRCTSILCLSNRQCPSVHYTSIGLSVSCLSVYLSSLFLAYFCWQWWWWWWRWWWPRWGEWRKRRGRRRLFASLRSACRGSPDVGFAISFLFQFTTIYWTNKLASFEDALAWNCRPPTITVEVTRDACASKKFERIWLRAAKL